MPPGELRLGRRAQTRGSTSGQRQVKIAVVRAGRGLRSRKVLIPAAGDRPAPVHLNLLRLVSTVSLSRSLLQGPAGDSPAGIALKRYVARLGRIGRVLRLLHIGHFLADERFSLESLKRFGKGNCVLKAWFGVENSRELKTLIPGTLVCLAVTALGSWLSQPLGQAVLSWQGAKAEGGKSPISGVVLAIVLGVLICNLLKLPESLGPGLKFCVKKVLRLGIILIGLKLSLLEVAKLGLAGIPVVVAAIVTGLLCIRWFNDKLGLPPRLGTLIAAGTSICGVTAVVSTAPVIDAEEKEVAYAVANVTCFGLIGMLVYPYLAPHILATSEQIGLFLGTAIHDTAQVMGAALTRKEVFQDDISFRVATVTKMTRNLFLAVVVPLLAWDYSRRHEQDREQVKWTKLLPAFVLGFVALSLVRTVVDAFVLVEPQAWKSFVNLFGDQLGARWCLGMAMAGVGLQTRMDVFKGVGFKPFLVGMVGALLVGLTGFIMASLLGGWVVL